MVVFARALFGLLVAACDAASTGAGLFTGDISGSNLAVSDGFVYWTTHQEDGPVGVWRGAVDGGELQQLWSGEQGGRPNPGMVVRGGRVFWAGALEEHSSESGLFSVPIDGGDRSVVMTFAGHSNDGGLAADDRAVYVAASSLHEVPLDGGPPNELAPDSVRWIVRRDTSVYFNTLTRMLLRLDLETGQISAVVPTIGVRFDVDGEAAYVSISSSIVKAPLDGSSTETIPVGGPLDIIKGANELYAVTADGLVRAPLDGGPLELLRESTRLRSIVLDGTSLFFAECACSPGSIGTIGRIDR